MITQVAEQVPDLIERLVYVAAFRPQNGESLADLSAMPEGSGEQVQANMVIEGDPPVARFDSQKAREVLYHDCSEDLARWSAERLGPQAVSLLRQPVSLTGRVSTATHYVICTEDRVIPAPLQRLMSTRDPARVFELRSGHLPLLSQPRELVDILVTVS